MIIEMNPMVSMSKKDLEDKIKQAELAMAEKIFADVKSDLLDHVADYFGTYHKTFDRLKQKYGLEVD